MLRNLKEKVRRDAPIAPLGAQVVNFIGLLCIVATAFIIVKFGFPAGVVFVLICLGASIILGKRFGI